MHHACRRLSHLAPWLKERLIRDCGHAMLSDGTIHDDEFLCFRAAAALINIPVSPLLNTGSSI